MGSGPELRVVPTLSAGHGTLATDAENAPTPAGLEIFLRGHTAGGGKSQSMELPRQRNQRS